MQRRGFPISAMPSFDSALNIELAFPHVMDSAEASAALNDMTMVDAPVPSIIESVETIEQNNPFQTCELESASYGTNMEQILDELFPRNSPTRQSRNSSVRLSDTDWQAFMNWSPDMLSSIGASGGTVSPAYRPLSTLPSRRSDSSPSRQGFTTNYRSERPDSLSRLMSTDVDAEVQNKGPIIADGIDPTTLVLPLQLMNLHPTKCHNIRAQSQQYSENSVISIRDDLGRNRWLEPELEDLLCWSCKSFAKAVRKRQSTRKGHNDLLDGEIGESSESRVSSSPSGRARKRSWPVSNFQPRRTGYSLSVSRVGILRATLGIVLNKGSNTNASDDFVVLNLKFMPAGNERTQGVCATFVRAVNELAEPRICPYVAVFNVVPGDSEIFRCVSYNDLPGIQKLFDNGEASPTDVDKSGFSLLSVRVQAMPSNFEG